MQQSTNILKIGNKAYRDRSGYCKGKMSRKVRLQIRQRIELGLR